MNIVNIGYDSTNYWLLAYKEPVLLIDAGWPGTLGRFEHAAKRAGVDLAAIPYVLCTHYHPDHAGLVADLQRNGTRLLLLAEQRAAVPELRRYVKPEQRYQEPDIARAIALQTADSRAFLAGIGIAGEILHTPGHSDDSVTLVLDEGAAFTGDLTPPYAAAEDTADLIQSIWERIRSLGVTTIYGGHAPPLPLR